MIRQHPQRTWYERVGLDGLMALKAGVVLYVAVDEMLRRSTLFPGVIGVLFALILVQREVLWGLLDRLRRPG